MKAKRTKAAKTVTAKRGRKASSATGTSGASRRKSASRSAAGRPKAPARRAGSSKTASRRAGLGPVRTAIRGTVAGAVAAVRRRVSRRPAPDAIVLLEADHRHLEDLLKRGEETSSRAVRRRIDLLADVTTNLTVHELIEEQIFYPALQAHPEAAPIVLEGFEEHHAANVLVHELHEVAADNEQWTAKFKVLQEMIQHHIDEEEGKMFRTARAVLGQDEIEALGVRMARMKAQALRG